MVLPSNANVAASRSLAAELATIIRGIAFPSAVVDEYLVQDTIEKTLREYEYSVAREHRLTVGERVDFLVTGSAHPDAAVGIEVKTKGSFAMVMRQLLRYAKCPEVGALVLATTRTQLASMPPKLLDKPVLSATCFGAIF